MPPCRFENNQYNHIFSRKIKKCFQIQGTGKLESWEASLSGPLDPIFGPLIPLSGQMKDRKTERQKDRKAERQKDRKTEK